MIDGRGFVLERQRRGIVAGLSRRVRGILNQRAVIAARLRAAGAALFVFVFDRHSRGYYITGWGIGGLFSAEMRGQ